MGAAKHAENRLSRTELAAEKGVTEATVRYWVERGFLPDAGPDHRWDRTEALAALENVSSGVKRGPKGPRKPKNPANPADSAKSEVNPDRRYRIARAEREELSVEKLRGELEPKTAVARSQERFTAVERSIIESIPSQWAEEIAAEVECDPRRMRLALERVSRATLGELEKRARSLAEKART